MREHDHDVDEDVADDQHAPYDPTLALLEGLPVRIREARLRSLSPARQRHLALFGDVPAVTVVQVGPLDAVRPQGARSRRRAERRAAAAERHRKATGR